MDFISATTIIVVVDNYNLSIKEVNLMPNNKVEESFLLDFIESRFMYQEQIPTIANTDMAYLVKVSSYMIVEG